MERRRWTPGIFALAAVLLAGCASGGAADPTPTPDGSGVTAIDGTYRWSTTEEEAVGTPAEADIGAIWPVDAVASVPNTFTLVLEAGEFTWQGTTTPAVDRGTYAVAGDTLIMTWDPPIGWVLTFEFESDPDGTLHTSLLDDPEEPVNEFVFTSHPWERID